MKGMPWARAASRQASQARTSVPIVFSSSTLGQQKLSRIAVFAGSAPTQTALRTASSIDQMAISYGSCTCGAMPQAIATPLYEPSLGRMTEASLGPICSGPINGLTTLPPCTSWSYWRMTQCLLATLGWARALSSASLRDCGLWIADWRLVRTEEGVDPRIGRSVTVALRVGIGMPL